MLGKVKKFGTLSHNINEWQNYLGGIHKCSQVITSKFDFFNLKNLLKKKFQCDKINNWLQLEIWKNQDIFRWEIFPR